MVDSIKKAQKIVVKIGTSSLTYGNGKVNLHRIERLAAVISDLKNSGRDVILVSSGAIGIGTEALRLPERPASVSGRQAAAAVGQAHLMQIYARAFAEYGYDVAQILLTKYTVDHEETKKNAENTFAELLKLNVIPVVNENDTVAVDEIKFGDNDNLSANVAIMTEADLLIILTDIDGFYLSNPAEDPDAKLIKTVTDLSENIEKYAGGSTSGKGTGGMLTKVRASRTAAQKGIICVIANGENPEVIRKIIEGEGLGTTFLPSGVNKEEE